MIYKKNKQPIVIDLFAGVGGLSLGACRAGFKLALAVEKDPHAHAAHALNFPGSLHSTHDIFQLTGSKLLEHANLKLGDLDGLIGGPPCQGFSSIGRQHAEDPRNSLFAKFFELVNSARPSFFIAENVPNIMSPKFETLRDKAFSKLTGYNLLAPIRVTASDYGAPTTRSRILFVGYDPLKINPLLDTDFKPSLTINPVHVQKALMGLPDQIDDEWLSDDIAWKKVPKFNDNDPFWRRAHGFIPNGVGHEPTVKRFKTKHEVSGCIATLHDVNIRLRYAGLKYGERDAISRSIRLNPSGFCPTLRAGTGSDRGSFQAVRPIHHQQARVITPREAARLQGFPDWFRFAPSKWHSFRQIGNSVSPILAESLLHVVRKKIDKELNAVA